MTRIHEILDKNITHYIDLGQIVRIEVEKTTLGCVLIVEFNNNHHLTFSNYSGYTGGFPADSEKHAIMEAWIMKIATELIIAWKAYTPHIQYVERGYGGAAGGPMPFPGSGSASNPPKLGAI
jgi:hypothetical protein